MTTRLHRTTAMLAAAVLAAAGYAVAQEGEHVYVAVGNRAKQTDPVYAMAEPSAHVLRGTVCALWRRVPDPTQRFLVGPPRWASTTVCEKAKTARNRPRQKASGYG